MPENFCILTEEGGKKFVCGHLVAHSKEDVFSLLNREHYHIVFCSLAPGGGLTLSGKENTGKS